jgi:GntR family transcriptional regulator, rspAB operon transcriptional repressor
MAVTMMLRSRQETEQRKSLRDQVYDVLRHRIITGEIAPGGVIDDKEIAGQLGISRTPVREAIKKLSDEHLVDVIAQSGTRASRIDPHEVQQAYLIRRALEMESAAQAALNMSAKHTDALSDILADHARAIEQKRFADAIATDDTFHRYIAGISNLNRLWNTIEISKAELDRCRHMMVPRAGEGEATLHHHREIIKSLSSGDSEAARRAMAGHLDVAYATAAKMLETENAGSFAPFTKQGLREDVR